MDNKKILWISNMYPGPNNPTYGIFIKEQADIMRTQQYVDLHIAAINSSEKTKLKKIKNYYLLMLKTASYFFRQIDLVHVHYVFPTLLYALPLKFLKKTKLVITFHGGDWHNKIKKNKINRLIFDRVINFVDYIIVVSPYLKNEILKVYPTFEDRISVIDMGIDLTKFSQKNLNFNVYNDIVFIGNFIKEKGVMEVLEAAKKLSVQNKNFNFRFVIGKKDILLFESAEEYCKENQLKNVRFEGPYSKNEINCILSQSFCTLIPSYEEGFGIVALEAMISRSPIINSASGGLEVLCRDIGLPIQPRSAEEIVKAIIKLSKEKEENVVKRLDQAEERALSYSMKLKVNEVYSVYDKILNDEL